MSVLYAAEECGCVVLLMRNEPRVVRDSIDDIHEVLLEGLTLHEAADQPSMECPDHRRANAERRSLMELGL